MAPPDVIFLLLFFTISTNFIYKTQCFSTMSHKFNTITSNMEKAKYKLKSYYNYSKYKQDNCPICLQPINIPTINTCGHAYHRTCIFKWYKYNNTCPICRKNINISLFD